MSSFEYLATVIGFSRFPVSHNRTVKLKIGRDWSFSLHKALAVAALLVFSLAAYFEGGGSINFIIAMGANNQFSWEAFVLDICLVAVAFSVFSPRNFLPSLTALIGAIALVIIAEYSGFTALMIAALPLALSHFVWVRYATNLLIGFISLILLGPDKE